MSDRQNYIPNYEVYSVVCVVYVAVAVQRFTRLYSEWVNIERWGGVFWSALTNDSIVAFQQKRLEMCGSQSSLGGIMIILN